MTPQPPAQPRKQQSPKTPTSHRLAQRPAHITERSGSDGKAKLVAAAKALLDMFKACPKYHAAKANMTMHHSQVILAPVLTH